MRPAAWSLRCLRGRAPRRAAAVLRVVCLCVFSPAHAEQKPLWEAGVGVAALSFPDYRGSDASRLYALPVPYFVYRGELLKADRYGVRGVLFDSDALEIAASAGASLPVDSEKNEARRGMPNLKPTVELGPAVTMTLWRSDGGDKRLKLRLPLRAAFTAQASPRYVGWLFSPRLNLDVANVGGLHGWNLGMYASPAYADRRFHSYFYGVEPEFAAPDRLAYRARRGYNGTEFLASLSKRFQKYWVGAFVRYDTLAGAAFEDSPLIRTRGYFAAGAAIAWVFGESAQRVESAESY
jgi:MipA family protein